MKRLAAFDLDGTLALSKQAVQPDMAEALADLLTVADVAVISGGDWPQFDKQVASNLPARADLSRLWMMPTTGTKLYVHKQGKWEVVYAELFDEAEKEKIISAFNESLEATGFKPEQTWGERIEDRRRAHRSASSSDGMPRRAPNREHFKAAEALAKRAMRDNSQSCSNP